MVSCSSSESAKTIVKNNLEELVKMDEFFWLESTFLFDFYDQLMEEKMRSLMLEITPGPMSAECSPKPLARRDVCQLGPYA